MNAKHTTADVPQNPFEISPAPTFPYLRVRDYTWWIWAGILATLVLGLTMRADFLTFSLAICVAQFVYFLLKEQDLLAFPVQLRGFFAYLVAFYAYSPLQPLLWTMVAGVTAMLTLGYCPLARILYLFPWNRRERLSLEMLRHTFLAAPDLGRARIQGRPAAECPGGVCTLEVQIGRETPRPES